MCMYVPVCMRHNMNCVKRMIKLTYSMASLSLSILAFTIVWRTKTEGLREIKGPHFRTILFSALMTFTVLVPIPCHFGGKCFDTSIQKKEKKMFEMLKTRPIYIVWCKSMNAFVDPGISFRRHQIEDATRTRMKINIEHRKHETMEWDRWQRLVTR